MCQKPILDTARRGTKRCSDECRTEANRRRSRDYGNKNRDDINTRRRARRNGTVSFVMCPVCETAFDTDGRRKYCSPSCSQIQTRVRVKEWRAARPTMRRWAERHSISYERVLACLQSQHFNCASCKTPLVLDNPKMVHIDHDHSCCTGRQSCGMCIRGILCFKCNIALGMVDDEIDKLQCLIHYLENKNYLNRF